MKGFQAGNVDAIRAERVVSTVKIGEVRSKAFQVFFGKDGSLFITFPYFRHRTGILCSAVIPVTGAAQTQVNLENGGKISSHLVKYSHHPDGRAHFSQDGKILTAVKRQSIALERQHGHLFSLIIQGLSSLDTANAAKDVNKGNERVVIDFQVEPADTVKFVGQWFDVNAMRFSNPTPTIGPLLPTIDPDGVSRLGCMVASPYANARHVLLLTCEVIPSLGPEEELFLFYGGFDPREAMEDLSREAGFLAFLYPVSEAEKIRERIGSVDYVPKTA
jgi:hypothetical protein